MKALFVGLGSIGQRHLRNLRRLRGADFEALAVRSTRAAPLLDDRGLADPSVPLAPHYGLREFDDLDVALAERPDLVFVTNPSSLHAETLLRAARTGAHVFVEKPLATDAARLDELRAAAADGGVVAVGFQFRFHPGLLALRRWIEAGRIGKPVSARFVYGEYLPDWHPWEDYRKGYAARADLGGGALLTLIHCFDLALWLFGPPETVYAVGGRLSRLETEVEDSAVALLRIGTPRGPMPVTVEVDYLRKPPVRGATVIGDLGSAEWDFDGGEARLWIAGMLAETGNLHDFDRNEMYLAELEAFLAATEGGPPPAVGLQEGTMSLCMALAAKRSLESGRPEHP